jgi:hypothetical protein
VKSNNSNGLVIRALSDFLDYLDAKEDAEDETKYDYPLKYCDDDYHVFIIPGSDPELITYTDENYGC